MLVRKTLVDIEMSICFPILRTNIVSRLFRKNICFNPEALAVANMSTVVHNDGASRKLLGVLEKSPKRFQRIKFLADLFKEANFELRIAGGAVRDILGGKEPQDIDFATTALPEQSLELVKRHEDLMRVIVTTSGQKHGTVAVKFKETELDLKRIKLQPQLSQDTPEKDTGKPAPSKNKQEYDEESPFEITTLRCDNITDGRHAIVEFVNDWKIDAERRDLTINAMFLSLDDGRLIDYFGGESDLKNGIVRFVGNAETRIKEDYLRILRYFRFWSRYGRLNKPDDETVKTIEANLEGLTKISGERIWQEVKKTLSHLPCQEVAELMLRLKVFQYVGLTDSEVTNYDIYCDDAMQELKKVEQNVEHYVTNFLDPKIKSNPNDTVMKKTKDLIPVILMAPMVQTQKMCAEGHKRMKFSNVERDSLMFIIDNRKTNPDINDLKYNLAMCHIPERPQTLQRIRALLIYRGKFDILDVLESWEVPSFPINGHLVAQEFKKHKLPMGEIKSVVDKLKRHWSENDYSSTKEDLEQVLAKIVSSFKQAGSKE